MQIRSRCRCHRGCLHGKLVVTSVEAATVDLVVAVQPLLHRCRGLRAAGDVVAAEGVRELVALVDVISQSWPRQPNAQWQLCRAAAIDANAVEEAIDANAVDESCRGTCN